MCCAQDTGNIELATAPSSHTCSGRSSLIAYGNYKEADRLERSDPLWLHSEEVSMVKVVLLRYVKAQLDSASLRAALDKASMSVDDKNANLMTKRIVEALHRVLGKQDGPGSSCRWESVVEALASDGVASAAELEALVDHFHAKLAKQKLSKAEVIGGRLYSGPPYVKMNGAARQASNKFPEAAFEHLQGNRYVNAVFAAASCVVKLGRGSRIPAGRRLYRGMAGMKLPDSFNQAGEDGARGGTEYGFLSCTTSKEVAIAYMNAEKGLPILLSIEVGAIDK